MYLLLPHEGGRKAAVRGSYRPIHNFGLPNCQMANATIDFASDEQLIPGETRQFDLEFIRFPALEQEMRPGREWTIQEGREVVGKGTVVAVLEEQGGQD